MKMIDKVYDMVLKLERGKGSPVSAMDLSRALDLERSTVSRYLNELYKSGRIDKTQGRPVLFQSKLEPENLQESKYEKNSSLNKMAGAKQSLSIPIERAKAAIIYPPRGLHTLLLGQTGVGKSLFAEQMYEYAREENILGEDAPFIRFNCADYANNPNLLTAQIFGVKKGTFTGAEMDREGLLKKAHNGIFFLDEVHRLPPEGQEMLFLYIDKGYFSPLGETEKINQVNVRIIAATTEELESYLLQTFSRRIPMVIKLPCLKERSIEERYSLVETFIREESRRLGKDIYINKNAMISYLLYDCPNNIGQLKSDIQLACAKAFLNYKANLNNLLIINQGELPNHVRKGLLLLQDHRYEINELIGRASNVLRFSEIEEPPLKLVHEEEGIGEDFYSMIEGKINSYKMKGLDEGEISDILNIDIESHFQRYIGEISKHYGKHGAYNIINREILDLVDGIFDLAKKELDKEYEERIYLGLSFHLERSIERIQNGERIYNPKLNFIRINYENEFIFAMKIAKMIDKKFNIETPVDEIGYLAMFFASDYLNGKEKMESFVKIMVIMHGKSTASSMVEVANNLIGDEFVIGLDMPLSMKPQRMYEIAKEKVIEVHGGKGVILMVDMGSLTNFGAMIMEETGIEIRTIDMVSTSMVLDVGRKAILGYSIEDILEVDKSPNGVSSWLGKREKKEKIILAACFTGDGLARKVKENLNNIVAGEDIRIKTINIVDDRKIEERIKEMANNYNILAIIGTMEINIKGIQFISAIDVFSNNISEILRDIIEEENIYSRVEDSLREHLTHLDSSIIINDIRILIKETEERLKYKLQKDVKMGMILHICFLIDKLLTGEDTKEFSDLDRFRDMHSKKFLILKNKFKYIEEAYGVILKDKEIAYVLKMFIENNLVCNSV